MVRPIVAAAWVLVAGCEHFAVEEEEPLLLLGGFRDPADQCRIVGETAFTNQFLDHTSTLVGCPEDYEGTGVFVTETGAVRVGETQGYELFTVPRG
jgi:hypothetical protein